MDDAQRRPKDSDREELVARINRAGDEGRISLADRDIRLGNVRTATSMAELDLMSRELDQLDQFEATMPGVQDQDGVQDGDEDGDENGEDIEPAAVSTKMAAIIISVVVAIAVIVAGVVYLGNTSGDKDTKDGTAQTNSNQEPATPADPQTGDSGPAGKKYDLSADGISGFLVSYRKKFKTSRVVEMTLYDGYAIVGVPVPGKRRQAGWLYRDGRWNGMGGIRAMSPGAQVVNTRQLDASALARNLGRARKRLNVEKAKGYAIVRFTKPADDAPRVDVYMSNEFNESGYLATRLDGTVVRAYPYKS